MLSQSHVSTESTLIIFSIFDNVTINNLYLKELYPTPLEEDFEVCRRVIQKRCFMVDMDSGTMIITDDNFSEIVKNNPRIVVDCWAPWCGPCRIISPLVEELAKEYIGKVAFGKLNVDENEKLPRRFNIMGIPTLLFIKEGELIDQVVGTVPRGHIVDKIDQVFHA